MDPFQERERKHRRREIIGGAIKLIEKGWTKGKLKRDENYCVLGALATSAGVPIIEGQGELSLNDHVYEWGDKEFFDGEEGIDALVDYNDDGDRTKNEMIDALQRMMEDPGYKPWL